MAGIPATSGTRMMWLYSTLGTLGQNFEYSDSGRSWLIDRISKADTSSRKDRSYSDWWEGDVKLSSHKGTSGLSPVHTHQRAALSQLAIKVPDLGLEQVLAAPSYREEFENYLEENLSGSLLPFLEIAQDWAGRYTVESERKHTYSLGGTTLAGDPKKLEELKVEALRIYSEYLGPSASGKLDIDRSTLTTIRRALRIDLAERKADEGLFTRTASEYEAQLDDLSALELVERAEATRDHSIAKRALDKMQQFPEDDQESLCERAFAILTDKFQPKNTEADPVVEFGATVFSEAIKQANTSLDSLFLAFKSSDDYVDMFDPDPVSTKAAPSTQQPSVSTTEKEKEIVEDQEDKVAFEEDNGARLRCPAWFNSDNYRSLRCEILDVHTKVSNLRALISIDSTTYKTFLADKLLREGLSAEFSISNTSQYLTLSLRSGNKEVGKLELPIGVIASGPQGVETWFTVNQMTKKENLAKMEIKLKITCRTSEPSPCSLQQVDVEGPKGGLTSIARGLVSKEKRRFQQDGFDLDLSYITDHLIAMGYPSAGAEGVYRNPIEFVQKFFDMRHPQAFLLYNLCAERTYDVKQFQGRVRQFPFEDHNPPAFRMIKAFCEDVRQFLNEHPQHAVSIHCKAGKGRTGTLISCYMVYAGLVANSDEALDVFAQGRTKNGKGVTIPSQIRYVHYFSKYCALKRAGKRSPGRTTLILHAIRFRDAEKQASSSLSFTITQAVDELEMIPPRSPPLAEDIYVTYENEDRAGYDKTTKTIEWDLSSKLIAVNEDVRLIFYEKTLNGKVKMFQFWFNTRMAELTVGDDESFLSIPKSGCDKICSDTKHKEFAADFRVELVFTNTSSSSAKQQELDESFSLRTPSRAPRPPANPNTPKAPPPLPGRPR